ncbi:hypothetical protein CCACVL1_02751 [Corchorus capsularis]|uniref:Reverse transcriptase zinc-binding domain-containing protein n=1 Tax=Corchorus capsularis TaxID=210143 RepID=A0A1R3K657_COCAP|nr:hypothetical protein CCACVL1_02751 [Corchorus capsularis]
MWFSSERDSLRRKVIVEKYGSENRCLLPDPARSQRSSALWKGICSPLVPSSPYYNCFWTNTLLPVGSGDRIRFWFDQWISDTTLKELFPRIFAISTCRDGSVADFGYWQNDLLVWKINLRRDCFDWEKDQLDALMGVLDGMILHSRFQDRLVWKLTPDGLYSPSSFSKSLVGPGASNHDFWNVIWCGLAPPKVEAFMWQAVRDRIAVKEFLAFRGLIDKEDTLCPLCNIEKETVHHLLLSCHLSWAIWSYFLNQWGEAGIGGVLRNHDGEVLISFSKYVGVVDSNEAEVLAVREAFLIFSASSWANLNPVVIESDSSNTVKWVQNPSFAPWRFRQIMMKIETLKQIYSKEC